jgi:hypothetical protein
MKPCKECKNFKKPSVSGSGELVLCWMVDIGNVDGEKDQKCSKFEYPNQTTLYGVPLIISEDIPIKDKKELYVLDMSSAIEYRVLEPFPYNEISPVTRWVKIKRWFRKHILRKKDLYFYAGSSSAWTIFDIESLGKIKDLK